MKKTIPALTALKATLLSMGLLAASSWTPVSLAASCVTGGSAEPSVQDVFNGMTVGGASSVNAATGCLPDADDSAWRINGSSGALMTIVIELAGNAGSNTFGVYDSSNKSQTVQLFGGGNTQSDQTILDIQADGSVYVDMIDTGIDFAGNDFGFYLGTADFGSFYSDSSLNAGQSDHMLAYQGKGDTVELPGLDPFTWSSSMYALAWEDLPYNRSDFDYNDFIVLVDSVETIATPVPAAVWLFSSGLLGLAGLARRRRS